MDSRPHEADTAAGAPVRLLSIAAAAIAHGLAHGEPPALRLAEYPPELRRPGASFVTLTCGDELRGCIGTLEPFRALAHDLVMNAYAAAFLDPRFPPLAGAEAALLTVEVAVLNPLEVLVCGSETELIGRLRPHTDGVVLEEGTRHRATFLPKVWEALPEPEDFLRELRRKAGLAPGYWSDTLRFARYTTGVIRSGYLDALARGAGA
ncbi:MAG: AmmeMemoRadiSam system protein A [Gammaproteobacteria bacterium]|nr:AmmeMemoRadiSam system protein A [Gammaproteobacteria bacterium]